MWRHFFAAGPALVLLTVLLGLLASTGPYSRRPATLSRSRAAEVSSSAKTWTMTKALALPLWAEAGAIFFMVDSIRRQYRTGRAAAIAFAILGVIGLGLTSLLYYAFWGHRRLEPASAVFGLMFCERCLALTTDQPAPDTMTHDLVLGTQFMGAADRCEQCHSVIRTLWFWVVVPVLPFGSYRVIATETNRYIGRRTSLRWSHVAAVYAVTLVVVLAIVYATTG
jgi:uncharacterized membrane protein